MGAGISDIGGTGILVMAAIIMATLGMGLALAAEFTCTDGPAAAVVRAAASCR